jgi:hypothetical protein
MQITVVDRMRARFWESGAAMELFFETKRKPPEFKRPAGRNSFKTQSRVYRSTGRLKDEAIYSHLSNSRWGMLKRGTHGVESRPE